MIITNEIVELVKTFLGEDGINFFKELVEKYGEISPVITTGRYPHSVHFHEGMQIRNYLRGSGLCDKWDSHDLDNYWMKIVERAII